ncbi:carbohydrate deacetylase [Methylococcus mesophilus]|uniref:carbohydrate deacetylase n=1 Tax=Methylococcus mesophilus TaxID=2993564 RepID=UPI00224A9481|nr:ChbG/HpnK family deacetylase [Methylococcus mesophilus]UZR28742.1 ChbG/HpnK family deacetylase [Methylococcus mesophilus]
MRLILHADDFGMSEDMYRATVDCFDKGVLTSATLMPLMPFSDMAIQYAKEHPNYSFGAHLTFAKNTVERPVSDPSKIPHLVDAEGNFMNSNLIRVKALCHQIPSGEIECEVKAQLGYFRDHGLALSHVDSHGHMHKLGPFPDAIAKVLPHFGISRVRAVQNIYVRKPLGSPTFWLCHYWGRSIRKKFMTTKFFFMPRTGEGLGLINNESTWFDGLVRKCQSETIEAGFHPGFIGWNDIERRALIAFAEQANKHSIELINWNEIR